jgi:hypothetical protein
MTTRPDPRHPYAGPRLECPPGPLTFEEYVALSEEDRGLRRKERQEAEQSFKVAAARARVGRPADRFFVLLWLPGMPANKPAEVYSLDEWDAVVAAHRKFRRAPLPAAPARGLRIVSLTAPACPREPYRPHGWDFYDERYDAPPRGYRGAAPGRPPRARPAPAAVRAPHGARRELRAPLRTLPGPFAG